jgi:hypothetical protein
LDFGPAQDAALLNVQQAGYNEIAAKIDQQAIADQLTRLEPEILAKY